MLHKENGESLIYNPLKTGLPLQNYGIIHHQFYFKPLKM